MKNKNGNYLLTMLTSDTALTIARFTSILGRWDCELETLVVSNDNAPGVSRITCIFCADSIESLRIEKQTACLHNVSELQLISHSPLQNNNLIRVRISCEHLSHSEACSLCNRHNALISGRTESEMTIETISSPKGLALFLNDVSPYGLICAEMPNVSYFPLESEPLVSGAC